MLNYRTVATWQVLHGQVDVRYWQQLCFQKINKNQKKKLTCPYTLFIPLAAPELASTPVGGFIGAFKLASSNVSVVRKKVEKRVYHETVNICQIDYTPRY